MTGMDDKDTQLAEQIDRLLEGRNDHGLESGFSQFCLRLAAAKPVPEPAFAEALNRRLRTQGFHQEGLQVWITKRRLSTKIGLALIAALIVVTVVYAVDTLLQRIINNDAGLSAVSDADLGTPLNLTQTVDVVTVNLQWVYAD